MLAAAIWLWLFLQLFRRRHRPFRGRRFVPAALPALRSHKPDWAIDEIVRLKALMPDARCRRVADNFNRLHAARHATTVSKTWVAYTVRRKRLEIEEQRREWKGRVPPPMAANRIWGLDLTGKMDTAGATHAVLGIVDHGSRLAIGLRALPGKGAITVLRALLEAIERYGKPRAIRTDSEAVFASTLFRWTLASLGIRHQRTAPHCPWQNGRVERFFGTLKDKLDRWAVDNVEELGLALGDFRDW